MLNQSMFILGPRCCDGFQVPPKDMRPWVAQPVSSLSASPSSSQPMCSFCRPSTTPGTSSLRPHLSKDPILVQQPDLPCHSPSTLSISGSTFSFAPYHWSLCNLQWDLLFFFFFFKSCLLFLDRLSIRMWAPGRQKSLVCFVFRWSPRAWHLKICGLMRNLL